jgi:2-polyprenyl-3-methyl-5-hydroxy-6-metoxy-1,4-benzoquinol methylase
MDKSVLVRCFGFAATLVHSDTAVLDRWLWLRRRLPETRNGERLVDIGCGSGAFSIGAARRGYEALGLSWDERNQQVAAERAELCRARATFRILDIRTLGNFPELREQFDVAISCETVEHVLDDRKLFRDMAACLKPGGRLLLTTPNANYIPIVKHHMGPFSSVEDGGHLRKGYSRAMLTELCTQSGLVVEEFSFCSGVVSQFICRLQAWMSGLPSALGWLLVLPLRPFPPVLDTAATKITGWPYYSICMEAYKPRFK